MNKDTPSPSSEFSLLDITIGFSGAGAQDAVFDVTVQEMHVWLLELFDLGDVEQMVVLFIALRESLLAQRETGFPRYEKLHYFS